MRVTGNLQRERLLQQDIVQLPEDWLTVALSGGGGSGGPLLALTDSLHRDIAHVFRPQGRA